MANHTISSRFLWINIVFHSSYMPLFCNVAYRLIDLLFHMTQRTSRNNTNSHHAIRKPSVSEY